MLNFGEVFAAAFCYKQISVTNTTNCDHSIILGPVFLHESSSFEAFTPFTACVSAALHGSLTQNLVIGSNDEKALRKDVNFEFPS